MDLLALSRQTRVVIVVGKGGVGKTTVAATLALAVANTGRRALLIGLDDAATIPTLFGVDGSLTYDERQLYQKGSGVVVARGITSDAALLDYLDDHGLARVARHLVRSGVLEVVSTAIPGIREVLVLGKVRSLADGDPADVIILDAPASGHAQTFLTSAAGLLRIARTGPLRDQAERVASLLSDPQRAQVLLVTLAEETPVNETVETAYRVEDEAGVALAGVVVNALTPERAELSSPPEMAAAELGIELDSRLAAALGRAARLRRARVALQRAELHRLRIALALPQIELPELFTGAFGLSELGELATALGEEAPE